MADATPTAAAAKKEPGFDEQVAARLTPEVLQRLRSVKWQSRLTSLWAPVTVFGCLFVLYLFVVETSTPSASWAQPSLKWFGVLMLVWFGALAVARTAVRPFANLRKARHQAFELLGEVGALVDKHREKLPAASYADLATHGAALSGALASGSAKDIDQKHQAAIVAADKHLAPWRKQSVLDFGMGFVKAFAVAMLIRTVFIEPFRIPSGSMIPTLEIGDQIFVNKFIYGVRIPFINKVPFVIVRKPERADVIVFNNPLDESKDFIKRVVGIPGDTVAIVDGVLTINGQPQPRSLAEERYLYFDKDMSDQWGSNEISLWRENLHGQEHLIGHSTRGPNLDNEGPWTVPEGHVFVMGDNRDNSSDSRYGLGAPGKRHEIGFVPYGHIKGKAMVVWLALGYGGSLQPLVRMVGLPFGVTEDTGLKTERFFRPVR